MAESETNAVDSGTDDTEPDLGPAEPAPPVIRVRQHDTLAELEPADDDDFSELVEIAAGTYIFGAEIARGGMGRIIEGRDRRAGRTVALKEILSELLEGYSDDERDIMLRRFEREARITAALQHPSIVPVYEIGTLAGSPFFSMKRVVGEPLDAVIDGLSKTSERLALLPKLIAVADALAYAHERGVIHRDLKPANVLVGAHGETVVIDWGLAKQLSLEEEDDAATSGRGLVEFDDGLKTTLGSVFGTPLYMPPEQARGEETDRRADVYAIGAILYHLLAGVAPYRDPTAKKLTGGVIGALKKGPPTPLVELGPDIPADLLSIVAKAMARRRRDRYADAGELAADLRQFQAGKLVGVHEYSAGELLRRWIRRHRAAVATAAVALAVTVVLGALALQRVATSRENALRSKQRAVDILAEGGREQLARRDLSSAAFSLVQAAALGSEAPDLKLMLGAVERMIPNGKRIGRGQRAVDWSAPPASRLIGIAGRLGRVELYDRHTGARVWSFETGLAISNIGITSDGKTAMVLSEGKVLELWDTESGVRRHRLQQQCSAATISADGKYVVGVCGSMEARVFDASTGEPHDASHHVFGPLGQLLISDSGQLLLGTGVVVQALELPSLKLLNEIRMRGLQVTPGFGPTGMLTHYPEIDGRAALVNLETGETQRYDPRFGRCDITTLSRDQTTFVCGTDEGRVVVFDRASGDVRVMSKASSTTLTALSASHDGSLIATGDGTDVVRVWSGVTGRLRSRFIGLARLEQLTFVANDILFFLDYDDGGLLVPIEQDLASAVLENDLPLTNIAYSPDGTTLWTNAADRARLVHRPRAGPARPDIIIEPAFFANTNHGRPFGGRWVFSRAGARDARTGAPAPAPPPLENVLRGSISHDGRYLARVSTTQTVLSETETGEELVRMNHERFDLSGPIEFAHRHGLALRTGMSRTLRAINLTTGHVEEEMALDRTIQGLFTDPDEQRALAVTIRGDLLLGLPDLVALRRFDGVSLQALMTRDGRRIVRSFNRHIEINDVQSGELRHRLVKFDSPIVAIAAGSSIVACATADNEVLLWNLNTGSLVSRLRIGVRINALAVTPDDREFAVRSDRRVFFYPIAESTLTAAALHDRLQGVFSAREFRARYHLDRALDGR